MIEGIDPVTMTEMSINQDKRVGNENSIINSDSQSSNNSRSPMGSFLSIESRQSSEEEEKVHDPAMMGRVKILKFEDTLADKESRQFKVIYDSLLLEGPAGNLTKSTLDVVLAQKPPLWLQVIYERLKHLVISSKTLQERKEGCITNQIQGKKKAGEIENWKFIQPMAERSPKQKQ